MFDWTITFGNLMTIVAFLGGGAVFAVSIRKDVDVISAKLVPLEKAVAGLTDVLVRIGRHDVELDVLKRNVERIDSRYDARKTASG